MKRILVIGLAGLMSVGLLAAGVQGSTSVKEHTPTTKVVKKTAVKKHHATKTTVKKHHATKTTKATVKAKTHEARPAAKHSKTTKHVARKTSTRHAKHVRHTKKGTHSASKTKTAK